MLTCPVKELGKVRQMKSLRSVEKVKTYFRIVKKMTLGKSSGKEKWITLNSNKLRKRSS